MNVIENENVVIAVSSSHVDGREPSVQSRLIAVVPTKLVSLHLYHQQRVFDHVSSVLPKLKRCKLDPETLKLGISQSWKITWQQNLIPKPEPLILYCDG